MSLAKATAPSSPPPSSVRPPPPPLSAPLRWLHSHRGALLLRRCGFAGGRGLQPADFGRGGPRRADGRAAGGSHARRRQRPGTPLIPLPAVPVHTGADWLWLWSGGRGGGGFSTRGGRAELTGLSRVWRESAQDWAVMNKSELLCYGPATVSSALDLASSRGHLFAVCSSIPSGEIAPGRTCAAWAQVGAPELSSGPEWKIQEVSRVGAQGVTSKSKLLAREMPDLHTGGLRVDSGVARSRKGARPGRRNRSSSRLRSLGPSRCAGALLGACR